MIRMNQKGFSLVELLVAIAIFGIIAAGTGALLSATLTGHDSGNARYGLYQEGLMIMERMTDEVRRCTFLLIPNNHDNDDGDNYFNDALFPRIDEDPGADMNSDNKAGIVSVDDDGDGVTDEGVSTDNDEDGSANDDPLDGVDNDGDGNIDEDVNFDANSDNEPGIAGIDDDGNGSFDTENPEDDDEDGDKNEDPLNAVVYLFDSGTDTLTRSVPHLSQTVDLSTRVSAFEADFEAPDRVLITLSLTGDDGEIVTFSERVYLENTYQRIGKRVK